ncbi:MAG: tyrosine-type recombinase/integrase [Lachnospiraceae bacterium]|nr:tyrosine-type recombinase/integrase [Lachnospiraceae bacterium]
MSGTQWNQLWEYVKKRTTEPRYYYRKDKDGKRRKHLVVPELGEYAPHNNTCQYMIDFHVTPHILRHTYITNLLDKGVDVKTVQHLAGHKSSKITMEIYAHLKYNKKEDIAQKINKAFEVTRQKEPRKPLVLQ